MSATKLTNGAGGVTVLAATLLALFFTSCGGGASSPAPALNNPGSNGSGQLLPLGSPVPALPADNANAAALGRSTSSAGGMLSFPGAVFLNAAGGTVEGDTLILQSSADEPAWAMYKADGLAGLKVDTFGVETVPGSLTAMYSVGLSNFSDGRWDYMINSVLPEVEIDLTQNTKRLVSELGNLYWIVVVTGGESVRVVAGHAFTEQGGGNDDWRPPVAHDISVSKGLPDRIRIEWSPVEHADSYQLFRRLAEDSHGEDAWSQIAATDGLSYDDMAVEPSTMYVYKVRGVNAAGTGGFSGTERGYMGAAPGNHGDDSTESHGLIGLLSVDRITIVGGESFFLNGDTRWSLADGSVAQASDFSVGDQVEVDGVMAGGVLTALAVKMEVEHGGGGGAGDDLRTTGLITVREPGHIRLGDIFDFSWGMDTQWFLADGSVANADAFHVGDQIEVEYRVDGGQNIATVVRMEVEHGSGGGGGTGDELTSRGTITVREPGHIRLGDDFDFSWGMDTQWFLADGSVANADSFHVGDTVEVEYRQDGGQNIAVVVRMENSI